MTSVFFWLLMWFNDNLSFEKVRLMNRAKEKAETAYWKKNYSEAVNLYQQVVESSVMATPESRINLANSHYQMKQYQRAKAIYERLSKVSNPKLASDAHNQLGVLSCISADSAAALTHFTQALLANNNNNEARFNYEFIKKRFKGRAKVLPQKSSPDELVKQNKKQQPQSQEAAVSDQRKDLLRKLRNLRMTDEQAQLLLDALKNSEAQYIQQVARQQKNASATVEAGSW